jgi:hypothetical protein
MIPGFDIVLHLAISTVRPPETMRREVIRMIAILPALVSGARRRLTIDQATGSSLL